MTSKLHRRLTELEKKQAGQLRRRYVWWREGMPEPQGEPGEQLTVIRWMPAQGPDLVDAGDDRGPQESP
jgi:hypothetical protein